MVTPDAIRAEIKKRIAEAEALAEEPESDARDLDCFYMASGILTDLDKWIVDRMAEEAGFIETGVPEGD